MMIMAAATWLILLGRCKRVATLFYNIVSLSFVHEVIPLDGCLGSRVF